MSPTAELILDKTDQELRAVLLNLAGGSRGRAVRDAAVTEIAVVLVRTRNLAVQDGTS